MHLSFAKEPRGFCYSEECSSCAPNERTRPRPLHAPAAVHIEPIGSHSYDECEANIPHGEGTGDHEDEALAFVLRYVASAERQLRAGQEEDHPQDWRGEEMQQSRHGAAEKDSSYD